MEGTHKTPHSARNKLHAFQILEIDFICIRKYHSKYSVECAKMDRRASVGQLFRQPVNGGTNSSGTAARHRKEKSNLHTEKKNEGINQMKWLILNWKSLFGGGTDGNGGGFEMNAILRAEYGMQFFPFSSIFSVLFCLSVALYTVDAQGRPTVMTVYCLGGHLNNVIVVCVSSIGNKVSLLLTRFGHTCTERRFG